MAKSRNQHTQKLLDKISMLHLIIELSGIVCYRHRLTVYQVKIDVENWRDDDASQLTFQRMKVYWCKFVER